MVVKMQSNWKTHLESNGAVIENNIVVHYGDSKHELAKMLVDNKTVVADLSHYGLIKISGSDAKSFLQSQFSNDINLVTESQAQLNSYCSPKGRVLALFNLFQVKDHYYLQLPRALLDSILKRLTMFKMRADVELVDVSDNLLCIGVSGPSAGSILKNAFKNYPDSNYACLNIVNSKNADQYQNTITIIQLANTTESKNQSQFLIFANSESLINFWTNNNDNLEPIGCHAWSLLNIQSGIPSIETETIDAFVPQMLNLQLINAVSFSKGCYPGQEIVARTQYLGKLKKRMYLLKSKNNKILAPGTDLSTEKAIDDQSKGKIVNCQVSIDGSIEALAVLQISSVDDGKVVVKSEPNIKFSIQNLPYSFEEPKS